MPSYLDFDATKRFRDEILKRTLDPVYGNSPSPKTFNNASYNVRTLNDMSNISQPEVDSNRISDLTTIKTKNIYKPEDYVITENIIDLPRRANLNLYPYFTQTNFNLIGIMGNSNYDTESELFKFAAYYIRNNSQGPVFSRIQQNLNNIINGKNRLLDGLSGNSAALLNVIRGKEPIIEGNNKITVARTPIGKGIDFLQTVSGTQLPWSEIPDDYLSNPRNPINLRPTNVSETTRIWQDLTGTLGSIIGIQRRPLPTRKPSDLMIEYMGDATKNRLFDLLSYSKYAPNYTTTARSQQTSRLFNFPNQVGQSIKRILGTEAPDSVAYIGDDRANDVKNTTSDLISGRKVRSSYYLSLLFDPVATQLFHTDRPYSNQGNTSGKLTWISKNKKTGKLDDTRIAGTLSTAYDFREDSILYITQDILNSKPDNGGDALSHVANVIDQTTKYFKDGDTLISRGSAVKYLDNTGRDIGVEYARVWTKDRPYYTLGDTAPYYKETEDRPYYKKTNKPYRRNNIRKFDGSVMSNTWNLNIAPMSNGNKSFDDSTNIVKGKNGFYAKKYMFSIENLAWKTSTLSGFTVSDLPYCERGNNGGRVMWFPPYDLKVSEQSSANWDKNSFLGRPEPIYTYQNTERSGQVSFKIVVDHPSILNLLVRDHFKNMNEEQVDDYINAFFAGAKDIDFYSLIRTYTSLEPDDIELIQQYLNSGTDKELIKEHKKSVQTQVVNTPSEVKKQEDSKIEKVNNSLLKLYFNNGYPQQNKKDGQEYQSPSDYKQIQGNLVGKIDTQIIPALVNGCTSVINGTTKKDEEDRRTVLGSPNATIDQIPNVTGSTSSILNGLKTTFTELERQVNELKTNLQNGLVRGDVKIIINSSASSPSDDLYNLKLTLRRTHSVIRYVIETLGKPETKWVFNNNEITGKSIKKKIEYSFQELGFEKQTGNLIFETSSNGENVVGDIGDCSKIKYNNRDLLNHAPQAYGCRQSDVLIDYQKITQNSKADNDTVIPITRLVISKQKEIETKKKPPIDVMKRIIMKTLSECYYFKKLEETSPIVFNSLKEKLKYFHPAFHSTTPEGLNARLTFLQQCLRPGDTIPIKGVSDESDLDARNTSFGPPPICVLRIGDFYHSKVIIRDMNITYDENVWDMNPEGIGIQPMIANVNLQINFIGGQGLEKPVERLQNALSSNFYANTEMYDERSISTTTSIGGVEVEKFTKEFLNDLQKDYVQQQEFKSALGQDFKEGQFIGSFSGNTKLNYTSLINDLYKYTTNHFESFETMYNNVRNTFSKELATYMIDKNYRQIIKYDVFTGLTSSKEINLFGLHVEGFDMGTITNAVKREMKNVITKDNINQLFNLDTLLTPDINNEVAEVLYNYVITEGELDKILDSVTTSKIISDFEVNRDKIINTLDKLNFITQNGYDVKIENGKSTNGLLSEISGDTSSFYSEYESCVTYIEENVNKFYEKMDTSVDFITLDFDVIKVKSILSQMFSDRKSILVGRIKFEVEDLMGKKITDPMMNLIDERLSLHLKQPEQVKFKFKKSPKRKNEKNVVYTIGLQDQIETTQEIKNLFSTKYKVSKITDKLNFYKK